MSVYDYNLPNAFVASVDVTAKLATEIAEFLISTSGSPLTPNGSSFAITSDTHVRGMRRLWVSNVSKQRIENNKKLFKALSFMQMEA